MTRYVYASAGHYWLARRACGEDMIEVTVSDGSALGPDVPEYAWAPLDELMLLTSEEDRIEDAIAAAEAEARR